MSPARRYQELRASGRAFTRAARGVTGLLLLAGAYSFLTTVRPILPDAPENLTWGERRVIGIVALVTLGGFGLAAWSVGRLLRAAGEVVEVVVDAADAAVETNRTVESHVVPALNRAVAALERLAEVRPPAPAPPSPATSTAPTRPPEVELGRLRARFELSRAAEDALGLIEARDALTAHLQGDALHRLDREAVTWLANWVRRRAAGRSVGPEVAEVAARTADSFADTPEGRALLAALPDLRRRAGLCPRCGRRVDHPDAPCPQCPPESAAPRARTAPRNPP